MRLRLLEKLGDTLVAVAALGILQLNDVGMRHVLVVLRQGRKEDVRIAALVVQLRDRAIETALTGQRQRETMHERLALLSISL